MEVTIRLVTFNGALYGVAVARDITERSPAAPLPPHRDGVEGIGRKGASARCPEGCDVRRGGGRTQKGDLLFLYTDGVTEAQNEAGEMSGRTRLCDLLHAMQEEPPSVIIDAVLGEVAAFTGSSTQEDDVTMVVMKVE